MSTPHLIPSPAATTRCWSSRGSEHHTDASSRPPIGLLLQDGVLAAHSRHSGTHG
ncbi:hypothetical protein [Mycetocola reblochoni]|uniref:Uncharacterized protein n=1 Tax=Mycetocola reblochoni REB411 TaxID=1255698 RepID=A0A1R4JH42_9MICO|nr:hypothetical protein [Mycetocola reblochoni]SJN31400.1 hypothetical protein FM119_07535 [Mycetocola reblochoni REB411]